MFVTSRSLSSQPTFVPTAGRPTTPQPSPATRRGSCPERSPSMQRSPERAAFRPLGSPPQPATPRQMTVQVFTPDPTGVPGGARAERITDASLPARVPPAGPPPFVPAQTWLLQGNELFRKDGHAKRAAPRWLRALEAADHATLDGLLAEQGNEGGGGSATRLALLQRAWVTPRADVARDCYLLATQQEPQLHQTMEQLLVAAKQHPGMAGVAARLWRRTSGLLPRVAQAQWTVVAALRANDFVAARATSLSLEKYTPHLLAPRCALFICDFALGGGAHLGSAFEAKSVRHMYVAAKLIAEALIVDVNVRLDAMGALDQEVHRELWARFLGCAYAAEPSLFGAPVSGGAVAHPGSPRHVAGVPWHRALRLPLLEPEA